MKSFSASTTTTATPRQVWRAWVDLPHWPLHDPTLEWVKLDSFGEGARGKLKPQKGPASTIIIEQVVDGRSFSIRTPLPLCVMLSHHIIEPLPNGETRLEFSTEFKGLLSGFFYQVIGKGIEKSTSTNMQRLAQLALEKY